MQMDYEALVLYTWHDIERRLLLHRNDWPTQWIKVDVFSTEAVIYVKSMSAEIQEDAKRYLKGLLKQYFDTEANMIQIPVTQTTMQVYIEEATNERIVKPFPLFKDFSYVSDADSVEPPELDELDIPVVAFHSYKGGVGRTLTLIAAVREMMNLYGSGKKVLIVDGDTEAPGLTWLGRKNNHYTISYLDVLAIIGAKGNKKDIVEDISRLVGRSSLVFQGEKLELAQYFLPTYREENQMLDVYSNPERIMAGETNKYIIADTLAQIGKCLDVDAVFVDLRAGFSEYSSPFLFDPRVDKYLISSTSLQSVSGTNLVLRELRKQKGNDSAVKKIFFTMVKNDVFWGEDRDNAYHLLLQEDGISDGDDVAGDIQMADRIEELAYNEALIHLGDLEQICKSLDLARNTTKPLKDSGIVAKIFESQNMPVKEYDRQQIRKFRKALHEICEKSIAAEGGDISNMLTTRAVRQLGDFSEDIPRINILGAKGSGKTYLYLQMLKAQTWEKFLAMIGEKSEQGTETLICPVLCSEDRTGIGEILTLCREKCNKDISQMKFGSDFLMENTNLVKNAIKQRLDEQGWHTFWQKLILGMFEKIFSWEELQENLKKQNRKIIFLFDGLENIFEDFEKDIVQKCGIRTLCRGTINFLTEQQGNNVGIIVFLRKDIAELSIGTNFEQFRSQYVRYELNWTQKDALQLALKLADRAGNVSGVHWRDNPILVEEAGRDMIEEDLAKVWGVKMGQNSSNQAYTVRWVLASLSDFNGQLQARDIVRFMEYAAGYELNDKLLAFQDRFLFPDDMKQAIRECSREKFGEVEKEIYQLQSSFRKLQEIEQKDKQVPLQDNVMDKLGIEDKRNLERFGYLKEADGEYYISESIRYALGYNKSRRGGVKLVSLLVTK
ncbi:MAG: hypothetical protein NC121_01200 [Blautia sp.]|nr:hypothetical protein [Blautia sp.]